MIVCPACGRTPSRALASQPAHADRRAKRPGVCPEKGLDAISLPAPARPSPRRAWPDRGRAQPGHPGRHLFPKFCSPRVARDARVATRQTIVSCWFDEPAVCLWAIADRSLPEPERRRSGRRRGGVGRSGITVSRKKWWAVRDSNSRPPGCKPVILVSQRNEAKPGAIKRLFISNVLCFATLRPCSQSSAEIRRKSAPIAHLIFVDARPIRCYPPN